MKRMKYVMALILALALMAGAFSACALIKPNDNRIPKTEIEVLPDESETVTEKETASETDTEPASEPASETDSEPASETDTGSVPDTEPASDPITLPTAEELEEFLSRPGINGFLISTYSDVRDASLREVIYQADDDEIPYEDVVSVLEKKHGHELMSSVSYISAEKLQALVLERTGFSLDEFRGDLSDYYMNDEDLDLYYVEHGDTNMQPVKVLEVGEESGKIVVRYTTAFGGDWFWINANENYGSAAEMEVVLIPSGDGFRFVSNQPVG